MNFTIVIPLHNKEKHIKRAIYSVLDQTHNKLEVLVVDDGSTDASKEKVKEIKDSRIELIEQENKGVSEARNTGISKAKYDYIGLLDADDVWKPFFLEKIKKLINIFPNAGAYATYYEIKGNKRREVPRNESANESVSKERIINYFKESIKKPTITSSSVVIPKKTFNTVGYFPQGIAWGEDRDMWCRIAVNYDIAFSDEICAIYFQDSENMATKKQRDFLKSYLSYVEEFYIEQTSMGKDSFYFKEYMIKQIIDKAKYFININQRKEARKLLFKYKNTKLNKRLFIETYLSSYLPFYLLKKWIGTFKKKLLEMKSAK